MRATIAFATTLLLLGCEPGDLPEGSDFARLETPMTHYGLDAFRRGEAAGITRAQEELFQIARDELRPGDDQCSQEAMISREADRLGTLMGRLGRVGLLNATEVERFVFFESFAHAPGYRSRIKCRIDGLQRMSQIIARVVPRERDAMTSYYWVWRGELEAALGADAEKQFTAAADRLVQRGLPRSEYR